MPTLPRELRVRDNSKGGCEDVVPSRVEGGSPHLLSSPGSIDAETEMEHIYWTTTLMPGEGWIVRRYLKSGTLFAKLVEEYTRLTADERDAVLDDEVSWLMTGRSVTGA